MFVVGLTAGIGCGATTVAKMLAKKGFEIISADKISRSVFRPNSLAWRKAVRVFGKKILDKNCEIDRRALGSAAFASKKCLSMLNKIAHPIIIKEIKYRLKQFEKQGAKIVVLDAPLLVEAKMLSTVDFLVVVKADFATRVKRIVQRDFFYPEEAVKRINAQIPLEKKLALADFVIDNNGKLAETRKQVEKLSLKLKKLVKKNE